jgi:hypothetical protein
MPGLKWLKFEMEIAQYMYSHGMLRHLISGRRLLVVEDAVVVAPASSNNLMMATLRIGLE